MSISTKIKLLTFLGLVMMVLIGIYTENMVEREILNSKKEALVSVSKNIIGSIYDKKALEKILDDNKLSFADKKGFSTNHRVYYSEHVFGSVSIYESLLTFYIKINYWDDEILLKLENSEVTSDFQVLFFLYSFDVVLMLVILFIVLRIVKPIKDITGEIDSFSKGNFSLRLKSYSSKEFRLLSDTFNNMAKRIENLLKTKEEALREVSHELRTPIAKGKLALENIEESHYKEILRRSFNELDKLTNILIDMERLNFKDLEKDRFTFETLFLESISSLTIDEKEIKVDVTSDKKIEGELHYLTIALRNLLDNALKYAETRPVEVSYDGKQIVVKNKSEDLTDKFVELLKPFTQESKESKGFGLGLSIVMKILDKHGFLLEYTYEEGYSCLNIKL